jgi:hypothetical protein
MGAPEISVPSIIPPTSNANQNTEKLITKLVSELEYRSRISNLDEKLPVVDFILRKPGIFCISCLVFQH